MISYGLEYLNFELLKEYLNLDIAKIYFSSENYLNSYPKGYENIENLFPAKLDNIMFFEDKICIKFLHKDTEYYMYHSLFDCKWSKTYSKNASLYIEFLENTLWLTLKKDSILYFTLTPEIESEQKGIYIFSESFTLEYFKKLFTDNKDLYITEFLMSKNFFYGMHNILKSEILAYSKISPRRINASIKEDKIEKLYEAIFIISRLLFNASIKLHDYEFLVYNVSGVKKEKFKDNLITYWNHDKQF